MTEEAKKKRDELAEAKRIEMELELGVPFAKWCDIIFKNSFDAGYQVAMDEANDKIYHATRKVPELEYEKQHLRLTLLSECKNHKYSLDRIEDLKERIQKLREALEIAEKELFRFNCDAPLALTVIDKPVYLIVRAALKADEEAQK